MRTVSFRIEEAVFERMQKHDANWSAVLREAVEAELKRYERQHVLRQLNRRARLPAGTVARTVRGDRNER